MVERSVMTTNDGDVIYQLLEKSVFIHSHVVAIKQYLQ